MVRDDPVCGSVTRTACGGTYAGIDGVLPGEKIVSCARAARVASVSEMAGATLPRTTTSGLLDGRASTLPVTAVAINTTTAPMPTRRTRRRRRRRADDRVDVDRTSGPTGRSGRAATRRQVRHRRSTSSAAARSSASTTLDVGLHRRHRSRRVSSATSRSVHSYPCTSTTATRCGSDSAATRGESRPGSTRCSTAAGSRTPRGRAQTRSAPCGARAAGLADPVVRGSRAGCPSAGPVASAPTHSPTPPRPRCPTIRSIRRDERALKPHAGPSRELLEGLIVKLRRRPP